MARIRVNTDDLKTKAKDLETAANAFNTAGDKILAAAMAMPSYEGQLSSPARAAAYEIQRQSREVQASLSSDAQSLQKTAQDFENVNNQTVDIIGENTALLSDSPIYGGPGGENDAPIRQGGSPDILGFDFLAYKDYGDYVIIWRNGKTTTIIVTDQNRSLVQQYENDLDDYFKNLTGFLSTIQSLLLANISIDKIIAVIVLLIGANLLSAGLIDLIPGISSTVALAFGSSADAVREVSGLSTLDIIKKCGAILDPLNPTKYVDDVEKFIQYGQGTSKALDAAENDWNKLFPPIPLGPTSVPVPTPPTPASTPTPTPTP